MTTPFRILTPDAQFHDDGAVERATAGPDCVIDLRRARRVEDIPDAAYAACDAMLVWHELPINHDVVKRLSRCRVIVRAGVGFDHLDLEAAGAAGIPVCNTPDYGTSEVADHAIALMLGLRRGLATYHRELVSDPVKGFDWGKAPLVKRNRGTVFGVLGMGRIGTATALRAKAFGFEVIGYDPYAPRGQEISLGIKRYDSMKEFLGAADIVSIHTPLNAETRSLIDRAAFAAMRSNALVINTARGAIIDLDDLYQALKDNRIAGAGIDVFPEEPADLKRPFWQAVREQPAWLRERILLSPHAAWYSPESQHDARRLAVETLVLYLRSGELRNCVNREYLRAARPWRG
ncbi:MAG: C-terminal binding protein [Gammaproteobacteria bacterium]